MTDLRALAARLIGDRRGLATMEYGVIAFAIITAISAAVATIGGDMSSLFSKVSSSM